MKEIKLIWKTPSAPTGRFRSFYKRNWPMAYYPNGEAAAMITCEDAYIPPKVKQGNHEPLTVLIACWTEDVKTFKWAKLREQMETLPKAKEATLKFLNGMAGKRVVHPLYRGMIRTKFPT